MNTLTAVRTILGRPLARPLSRQGRHVGTYDYPRDLRLSQAPKPLQGRHAASK